MIYGSAAEGQQLQYQGLTPIRAPLSSEFIDQVIANSQLVHTARVQQQQPGVMRSDGACANVVRYVQDELDLSMEPDWNGILNKIDPETCTIPAIAKLSQSEASLLCTKAADIRALAATYKDRQQLPALQSLGSAAEQACASLPPLPPYTPPDSTTSHFWTLGNVLLAIGVVLAVSAVFASIAGIMYVLSKHSKPTQTTGKMTTSKSSGRVQMNQVRGVNSSSSSSPPASNQEGISIQNSGIATDDMIEAGVAAETAAETLQTIAQKSASFNPAILGML